MKSPFPGMDPYLERHWGDVHHRLIQYACDTLQPGLPADLVARVEERVFLETDAGVKHRVPDVRVAQVQRPMMLREGGSAVAEPEIFEVLEEEITEGYIEIREHVQGKVITVIEFLSPTNKSDGEGQQKYLEKQQQLLRSDASLVEIDLVRSGQRVLALPNQHIAERYRTDYLACISPGWKHSRREVYRMPFRERLPALPIPLRQQERALPLDLQALADRAYEAGRYELIDYSAEPEPPFSAEDVAWATGLLKAAGRR